jgi:hypothetical protein
MINRSLCLLIASIMAALRKVYDVGMALKFCSVPRCRVNTK